MSLLLGLLTRTSKETKRRRLTFGEKCELIEEVKSGASKQSILHKYGINAVTYKRVMACESDLYKGKNHAYQNKKSTKTCENVVLDAALMQWFDQERERGVPISGPDIKEKALVLNEQLNGPRSFKASNGWLYKFKKRYDIRCNGIQGEKSPNDHLVAAEFSQILKAKIECENLNVDNIYNANESGVLWRQLMACTLALQLEEEEASGRKECKDRVTALFCANATGSNRMPLLIIGNYKNPRCLSDLITNRSKDLCFKNLESLGVTYTYQRSALMDRCIFMLWFKDEFIPLVLEHQRTTGIAGKVVLLLDNSPSHPSLDELNAINENFEVVYFPPKVTALIQPMDQGLITTTKKLYKKNLLRHLLLCETPEAAVNFLKELYLRDCFGMLSLAWYSLDSCTLQKAWKLLLGDSFDHSNVEASANALDPLSNVDAVFNEPESPTDLLSFPHEICDQVSELLSGQDYPVEKSREFLLKWFENDNNDNNDNYCAWDSLSDSDNVNSVINIKSEPEFATEMEISENFFEDPESMVITASEAFEGLMKFKNWLKWRAECLPQHLDYIKELENLITQSTMPEIL